MLVGRWTQMRANSWTLLRFNHCWNFKNYLVEFKKTESQTFRVCPVIIHNLRLKAVVNNIWGLKLNLECYLNGKAHRTTWILPTCNRFLRRKNGGRSRSFQTSAAGSPRTNHTPSKLTIALTLSFQKYTVPFTLLTLKYRPAEAILVLSQKTSVTHILLVIPNKSQLILSGEGVGMEILPSQLNRL